MSATDNQPVVKHIASAKEVAAGHAASRAWIQDLAANHLLRTQDPISSRPAPAGKDAER